MKIAFESSVMMPPISDALSILTSGAKICLDDIQYNVAERTVKILMKRKELMGFKKSFLGVLKSTYNQARVDAILTIRQVVEMNIEVDDRLVTECNSCFTVLLGLDVNGNELHLASAEEASGKGLCHVFITVEEMSIECVDT